MRACPLNGSVGFCWAHVRVGFACAHTLVVLCFTCVFVCAIMMSHGPRVVADVFGGAVAAAAVPHVCLPAEYK